MVSEFKPMLQVVISVLLLVLLDSRNLANANPQVPCYFIFGDSLSDNGNNNDLLTLAKVNYSPYGINFPEGPTGRFSNGRNMHDFLVELLGFEHYIPPFANLEGQNILNGVNYASGAAGICDESGKHLGARIPLKEQIRNHKTIISRITRLMRNASATNSLLSQCIYTIQIGSNDYINNYFNSQFYDTSRRYTPSQYATLLIQQLSLQLKALYDNGGRKFAMYGIGLIGCTPDAISVYGTNGSACVDKLNEGAALFNDGLKSLVNRLNKNPFNAKFTYLNPSGSPADLSSFGGVVFWLHIVGEHSVTNGSCCKTGGGGRELCIRNSEPCSDPRRYIFWDGVHTTDAWNEIVAKSAYSSQSPLEVSPFNIQQLATH